MVVVITSTARENNPQPITYLYELVIRQIEANHNLVEVSHLASGRLVKAQDEGITSKRRVGDAAIDDVALNRNLDINSANAWSVVLCTATSLQQQAIKRGLVGRSRENPTVSANSLSSTAE